MTSRLRQRPRLFAALAFGVAGMLLPAVWFGPVLAQRRDNVVLGLYVALPGLAAALAGGLGAPLLVPTRCGTGIRAALRGAGIAAAALVVFAPLFAFGITWTEPGWTSMLGLTALVLWFSLFTIAWAVAAVGAVVGWLVWRQSPQHIPVKP